MFTELLAVLLAQATEPLPPCKVGDKCAPWERQWRSDPVVAVPDGLGGYKPAAPTLGPGRHELVVPWPGSPSNAGYRRVYSTGTACLNGRAAVLDEHSRKIAAQVADASARGFTLAPGGAPYVICVPVE